MMKVENACCLSALTRYIADAELLYVICHAVMHGWLSQLRLMVALALRVCTVCN